MSYMLLAGRGQVRSEFIPYKCKVPPLNSISSRYLRKRSALDTNHKQMARRWSGGAASGTGHPELYCFCPWAELEEHMVQ